MSESTHLIHAVTFDDAGGMTVEYMVPRDDVKANGIVTSHAISIPAGDDYDDEIEFVRAAAQHLLADVLDDLDDLPPYDFDADKADDLLDAGDGDDDDD